jgi:hypothetical protein
MSSDNRVYDCHIIDLSKTSKNGIDVTVITNSDNIPFDVKRIYYLYDVPEGESRGAHGHKNLQQFIIATSGSFDILIDDGFNRQVFTLSCPNQALYVVPGMWRELLNFTSDATCLVLASEHYDESDYIRKYRDFINFKNA